MFRQFITSINYEKLIEMQANEVTGYLSKDEVKGKYKNPSFNKVNTKSKVKRKGK